MDPDEIARMTENIKSVRNSKRPTMEDVVRVLDGFFERMKQERDVRTMSQGPTTWSWADMSLSHYGYEKWFSVTESAMEGAEGHPLLTIRQSTAPRLDAWVTVSSLVMGPSDLEIEASFVLALTNQTGAFEGLRQAVIDVVEGMGGSTSPDRIADEVEEMANVVKREVN